MTSRFLRLLRWLSRTLDRLHRLAESGWGNTATFTWGLAQSSVVPGPAEALLIPLAVADPPASWRLAAWTFAGTIAGGLVAFAIGTFAFDAVRPLLGVLGIGAAELERIHALADSHGPLLVLVSAFTPISTKVVSIAAGAFGIPFGSFLLALTLARGARLLAVAAVLRFAGERFARYLARRGGEAARADDLRAPRFEPGRDPAFDAGFDAERDPAFDAGRDAAFDAGFDAERGRARDDDGAGR